MVHWKLRSLPKPSPRPYWMVIEKIPSILPIAKSAFKAGSALEGLAFVSNRERKYAARKVSCNGKSPGQAFQELTQILKEARVRECQKLKQRHIIKGELERGKLYKYKERLFNTTVCEKSTKIAAISQCIK